MTLNDGALAAWPTAPAPLQRGQHAGRRRGNAERRRLLTFGRSRFAGNRHGAAQHRRRTVGGRQQHPCGRNSQLATSLNASIPGAQKLDAGAASLSASAGTLSASAAKLSGSADNAGHERRRRGRRRRANLCTAGHADCRCREPAAGNACERPAGQPEAAAGPGSHPRCRRAPASWRPARTPSPPRHHPPVRGRRQVVRRCGRGLRGRHQTLRRRWRRSRGCRQTRHGCRNA